jgi:hypothetical protein
MMPGGVLMLIHSQQAFLLLSKGGLNSNKPATQFVTLKRGQHSKYPPLREELIHIAKR